MSPWFYLITASTLLPPCFRLNEAKTLASTRSAEMNKKSKAGSLFLYLRTSIWTAGGKSWSLTASRPGGDPTLAGEDAPTGAINSTWTASF